MDPLRPIYKSASDDAYGAIDPSDFDRPNAC
jgi:hypothetical protein